MMWKSGETCEVGSADDVKTGRTKVLPVNRYADRIGM